MSESLDRLGEQPVLSYDDFFARRPGEMDVPKCNNFVAFFIDFEGTENIYRSRLCFNKLLEKNPSLAKLLTAMITHFSNEFRDARKLSDDLKKKLYQAYTIMRPYVKSDAQLFD